MSIINLITQLQIYDPILAMIIIIPIMIFIDGFRGGHPKTQEGCIGDREIGLEGVSRVHSDAIVTNVKSAMKNWGFKKDDIDNAIYAALKESPDPTFEALIKISLKYIKQNPGE